MFQAVSRQVSPGIGPNFAARLFQCSEKKEEDVRKKNLPLLLQKPTEQHKSPSTVGFFPSLFFFWMIYTYKRLPAGGINLQRRQENIPEIFQQTSKSASAAFRSVWEYSLVNRSSSRIPLMCIHVRCPLPLTGPDPRATGEKGYHSIFGKQRKIQEVKKKKKADHEL